MLKRLLFPLLLLFASPVLAADYWPHPVGAIYTYRNAAGNELVVTYPNDVTRRTESPTYMLTEHYSENAAGDVLLTYVEGYIQGAIDPEYFRNLGSAFVFLDLPLTGSWTSSVNTSCCYGACLVSLSATVLGTTQVTVPAGTFTVVQVLFTNNSPSCAPDLPWGTMSLDQNVGPVILPGGYELVSIGGAVGVEEDTWGSLKAHYR